MRPKTMESGIFTTNRNRPVRTSMLTRMLVPKPKNAFQSPFVHKSGLCAVAAVLVVIASSFFVADFVGSESGAHRLVTAASSASRHYPSEISCSAPNTR